MIEISDNIHMCWQTSVWKFSWSSTKFPLTFCTFFRPHFLCLFRHQTNTSVVFTLQCLQDMKSARAPQQKLLEKTTFIIIHAANKHKRNTYWRSSIYWRAVNFLCSSKTLAHFIWLRPWVLFLSMGKFLFLLVHCSKKLYERATYNFFNQT